MPSRVQVSGHTESQGKSRNIYFRYVSRECDFWKRVEDDEGKVVRLLRGYLDAERAKGSGL